MRLDLMDVLVCPVCKGSLVLTVSKENEEEIIEGSLRCDSCDHTYQIEDTIPNLLPPTLSD